MYFESFSGYIQVGRKFSATCGLKIHEKNKNLLLTVGKTETATKNILEVGKTKNKFINEILLHSFYCFFLNL